MADIKKYLIHDNGGRPFVVFRNGTTVDVFKWRRYGKCGECGGELHKENIECGNPKDGECCERLGHYTNITQFFEGEDPEKGFLGNSVLFGPINGPGCKRSTYVFVGWQIFSFTTSSPVTDYVSPVGYNDVSFPYAVTCDRVYLMANEVYIYKSDLKEIDYTVESYTTEDSPYYQYYRHDLPKEYARAVIKHEGFANGHEFPMDLIQKRR